MAERGLILATLAGIPKRDRGDVEAQVLMGAWRAVKGGRYRPDPKDRPRDALRKWLHGIAWRQASKYFESAYTRRVVLDPQPLARLRGVVGPNLDAQLQARETLGALADLPDWQREILLAVDLPESLVEYARTRGMHPGTAASRLRIAREALALRLRRRR
ncbi:sigma-70 family RNA polymerase sigma factor [Sorangium sp. So ce1128]